MLFGSVNLEDHAFHDLWTIEDEPKPFESQARKAQKREMAAWSKASRYDDMMNALTKAINNQGRNPKYHRETMARHRKEWPTLWKIIDKELEDYKHLA